MRKFMIGVLLFLVPVALRAAEPPFDAKVVSIHDGDTMRVKRVSDGRSFKIRLYAIDAPEITQTAGVESRDALRSFVGDNNVTVKPTGAVTYGRLVARVYAGNNYLNEMQVTDGWAWHYANYTSGEPEHESFKASQKSAKDDGSGLWAYPNPIAPWDYRRLVRDGEMVAVAPFALTGASPSGISLVPRESFPGLGLERGTPRFEFRRDRTDTRDDRSSRATHFVFGKPKPFDNRHRFKPPGETAEVAGITELKRIAFTIGHDDKHRVPAWVAMRWTKNDLERSEELSFDRPGWRQDTELPDYARGNGKYDYQNTSLQKGHMARDADVEAWGIAAVKEATLLSNSVPQKQHANHAVWGVLENEHRNIVGDEEDDQEISTVWVISGPVFYPGRRVTTVGNTGVPHATYKVIAWLGADNKLRTRGYIIGMNDTSTNLSSYLRSIDQVETATGLDFFSDLPDAEENQLEAVEPEKLWE